MVELNRTYLYQRATILSLLVMMLPGCATQRIVEWPAIEGQVIEKETGKPMQGAVVVALWDGVAPYTTSVCFHIESAITDAEGRYLIPTWRNEGKWNNLDGQQVKLKSFKRGYEQIVSGAVVRNNKGGDVFINYSYHELFRFRKNDALAQKFYLDQVNWPSSKRLVYLHKLIRQVSCADGESDDTTGIYRWLRAIYDESVLLVQTKEEENIFRMIRYDAAEVLALEAGEDVSSYENRSLVIERYMEKYFPL